MIIYFADRNSNIIGKASSNLRTEITIISDSIVRSIDTGITTFSCDLEYDPSLRADLQIMLEPGNYIFCDVGNEELNSKGVVENFYTIIEANFDYNAGTISIYSEDAGLDLLNYICVSVPESIGAKTITEWIKYFLSGYGWEIGTNEVGENTSKALIWDGESTAVERIKSIANSFDNAEVSYSFKIDGFVVTNKYINIYKKRGSDRGEQLRLKYDISNIKVKKTIENLLTAYLCTGGTPEGSNDPINLKGYTGTYTCEGNNWCKGGTISCDSTTGQMRCPIAMNKWKGVLDTDGLLLRTYTYDTVTRSELANHAAAEMKKYCYPEVNYEIDIEELPEGTKIGDTVMLIDDEGELYLSTRLLEITESKTQGSVSVTIGDYKIKDSGISSKVQQLADEFKLIAKNRKFFLWIAYSETDNPSSYEDISLTPSDNYIYMGVLPNQTEELTNVEQITTEKLVKFEWSKIVGKDGNDPIMLSVSSSNGLTFKNTAINTVLSVVVYIGITVITDVVELQRRFGAGANIKWYDSDDILVHTGFAYTVRSSNDHENYTVRLET